MSVVLVVLGVGSASSAGAGGLVCRRRRPFLFPPASERVIISAIL